MNKHLTVTRRQLISAVEAGIEKAAAWIGGSALPGTAWIGGTSWIGGSALPGTAQMRLRDVADTATWIGVGTYGEEGYGCPLTRAGLVCRHTGSLTPLALRLGVSHTAASQFAFGFDFAIQGIAAALGERLGTRVRVSG